MKIISVVKKICLCGLIILATSSVAHAEETKTKITATRFPDENFRNYVKTTIDKDKDGYLTETERKAVRKIDVSSKGIADLTGMEKFPYLEQLVCDSNSITTLDCSKNLYLNTLDCSSNPISTLTIDKNIMLTHLYCNSANLNTLSLSGNTYLRKIECTQNKLKVLDLTKTPNLVILDCRNNALSSLNFSKCNLLVDLKCSENKLKKLDVSNCIFLEKLSCYSNQIEKITFPDQDVLSLETMICQDNKISQLDLSNMKYLTSLFCVKNELVCLDVAGATQLELLEAGMQNASLETNEKMELDLSQVKGMDIKKIKNLKNATLVDGKIVVKKSPVTYEYEIKGFDSISVTITTTVHSHVGKVVEEQLPTCGRDGQKAYYICKCGKKFWDADCKETVENEAELVIPMTGEHLYDDGEISLKPTCETTGVKTYACQNCKKEKEEILPALGHDFVTVVKKATVKENGYVATKCELCGDVKEEITIYRPGSIKLKSKQPEYSGKNQKPEFLLLDKKNNEITNSQYSVQYPTSKKVGSYTAKITLKNVYQGNMTAKYTIIPARTEFTSMESIPKKVTVKWKKCVEQVDGYNMQYSTDAQFLKKNTKDCVITSKNKNYKSISNLKKGKKYYFRVRTYKVVSGKKYYSMWSKNKKITAK